MKKSKVSIIFLNILLIFILVIKIFSFSNQNNFLLKNEGISKLNSTENIVDYDIKQDVLSGNSVSYKINYKENSVWYWDAKKSDFVPPRWIQKKWDKWEYSSNPTFTIVFVGEIPESGDIPPGPYYSGWTKTGGYGEYTYRWNDKYKKASMPRIDKKNWEVTNKDDFNANWFQSSFNKWGWSSDKGTWKKPKRQETGTGNKDVWVDWKIESNDLIQQEGNSNVFGKLKDLNQSESDPTSYNNSNKQPVFDMSDSDNKKPPSLNVPEPKDGTKEGVSGTQEISIKGLSLGWTYHFSANLNYKDQNGTTKTYKTFDDEFTTKRNSPSDSITYHSNSFKTMTFDVNVIDPNSARISPIKWSFEDEHESLDSGENNSNHFSKTFFNLEENKNYTLKYEYDYSLFPGDKETKSGSLTEKTKPYYYDESEIEDFSITNISKDQMILNTNISTNNNSVSDIHSAYWKIFYVDSEGNPQTQKIDLINPTPGTNSLLFSYEEFEHEINLEKSIEIVSEINDVEYTGEKKEYSLDTNTSVDYSVLAKNSETTNHLAKINYSLSGNYDNIEKMEYSLNDSKWQKMNFEKNSKDQSLELNNLNASTTYNIKFKATSEEYVIYSNPFSFKTDRNPEMSIVDVKKDENSLSLITSFDKYIYLEQKYFDWNIMEKKSGKYILEGRQEVLSNGIISTKINGLNPNTTYVITTNILINNKIVPLDTEVKTQNDSSDHINNGYITGLKKKSNKFTLDYVGDVKTIDYSIDGGKTWVKPKFNLSNKKINLNVEENSYNEIYFKLNNSYNSMYSWHAGIDNHLVVIHHPFKVNVEILLLIVLPVFVVMTIYASVLWGKWWQRRKQTESSKTNMWGA